ncbi:3-phosphoshikimate 1-carboxyvinyltransferase [Brevundimonas sp. 2R-24]|uniref:3-phosphoshikimate 1-carboxyvinyltransferase n=1 Tax=Peiella sedimenti TaxID=3061083 RepID=A0ABT8SHL4_9CAUL|nr:3-phosphoshikimate 1-carboxyvinyltransferase [Caulobacteraceae bacterium XZ-24]
MRATPGRVLKGVATAPPDKSVSHRALILGALARGETLIDNLLESEDVLATARAVQALGAGVERLGSGRWRVTGQGRLTQPDGPLDLGNSGTGARLLMGAVAGFSIEATFAGDESLSRRPMGRVADPLRAMGARIEGERLPLTLRGGDLKAISHLNAAASAQVKSALLLAGLNAGGVTEVIEPRPSRDHTERMLRAFGASTEVRDAADGRTVRLTGGQSLSGTAVSVPGDPSSAAFPLAAALITPGSEVTLRGVMLNPLRTGLFQTWAEMGADLTISDRREAGGEEIGDITARASRLKGVDVPAHRAASMIDEYPILAVTAAFAAGRTVMASIGELRVKESDRIAAMARALAACGVAVEEGPDQLAVTGGPVRGGAAIESHGDHRIAMSLLVLGLAARQPVTVDRAGMIATSFPGFTGLMRGLGADIAAA